ncbi:hypothetical protein J6590_050681 [Homalodisca vitripennis]|nr:hypothetical protein J6590_050681 [Homalodisca vitripennis]
MTAAGAVYTVTSPLSAMARAVTNAAEEMEHKQCSHHLLRAERRFDLHKQLGQVTEDLPNEFSAAIKAKKPPSTQTYYNGF